MDPPKVRFDPEDFLAPTYWDRLNRGSSEYNKQRGTFGGITSKMRETRIDANEWIKAPEFIPRNVKPPTQHDFDFDQYNFEQPQQPYYPSNSSIPTAPIHYNPQHSMLTTSLSIPVQPARFPFVPQVGNGYSAYMTTLNDDSNSPVPAIILKKRRRRGKKKKNDNSEQQQGAEVPSDPITSSPSPEKSSTPESFQPEEGLQNGSRKPSLSHSVSEPDINFKALKQVS